ncbi:MAG: C25 family cysteine peptidase [Bacteroidota bacterium]
MKKLLLLICVFYVAISQAQILHDGQVLYGNEWIDYDRTYYKIRIAEDGIYKISYNDLVASGVFDDNEVPKGTDFQLFYRGEAHPFYVSTEGSFTSTDFIEFFGQKNDGWLDQFLYTDPGHRLNPTYSMYTDSSTYFLTWKPESNTTVVEEGTFDLNELPTVSPYIWVKTALRFTDRFQPGRQYSNSRESISCHYDLGEGYAKLSYADDQTFFLPTPNVYGAGPRATITTRMLNRQGSHSFDWIINTQNVASNQFDDWSVHEETIKYPSSNLRTNTGGNRINVRSTSNGDDRYNMAFVGIRYPRVLDLEGMNELRFELAANADGHYLEFRDYADAASAILYDLSNNKRYRPILESGVLKIHLPANVDLIDLYLTNDDQITTISNLPGREFVDYNFDNEDYDYILLSHNKLIDDSNGYVQAYADYRSSAAGGGFNPIVVDASELYDQFAYGIERHELGIKNFLRLAYENWDSEFLFILGKGVSRIKIREDNYNPAFDLVPTYGYPNSDYLFATFDDSSVPSMAVGRIAAYTPEHVRIYLEKIQEHEAVFSGAAQTLEDKEWTKRVLHFAGGDAAIQAYIRGTLTNLKTILDTSLYGSDAIVFAKGSEESVSAAPEAVDEYINEGTAMLTFFGHSAPNTLDFNLAEASEYQNDGRYPFFYAIGCNTNRVFDVASTLSEEWVLLEDKGAIGFFGSTWTTQLAPLANYATAFYQNFGGDNYGERLGKVVQATMADYGRNGSFSANQTKQVLMMHGDPAIQLYTYDAPDYLSNKQLSTINPNIIDLQDDEFQLQLVLHNIGKHIDDSLDILIEHQLSTGEWQTLKTLTIAAPDFRTRLDLALPLLNKEQIATGRNQVRILLDDNNLIVEGPEGAEANNELILSFFAARSDVQPIYPNDFGIVKDVAVQLQASTTDAFAKSTRYFIELDTTAAFDSPIKRVTAVEQVGGVVSWQPNFSWSNGQVYYWRIGIDNAATGAPEVNWKVRSFTYLEESFVDGWNQAHMGQLEQNEYDESRFIGGQMEFGEIFKEIRMINATTASGRLSDEIALFQDGFRLGFNNYPCDNGAYADGRINLVIYNNIELDIYRGLNPRVNCWGRGSWYMFDPFSAEDRQKLTEVLANIDAGDYGIFYTTQMNPRVGYGAENWEADSLIYGTNIFRAFESRTSPQLLRQVVDQQNPYILIFQADNPEFPMGEAYARNKSEVIEVESTFTGRRTEGSFSSLPIGPANSWGTLEWQTATREVADSAYVRVYAMANVESDERLLIDSTSLNTLDLSYLDAEEYPYVQLEYVVKDEVNRTPVQLDYWRVGFEARPDVALAPNLRFEWHADEIDEGDQFSLTTAIVNPTLIDMDSLQVRYTILDELNAQATYQQSYSPLAAKSTTTIDFQLPTLGLRGLQQLLIELNPDKVNEEQYAFNNVGVRQFDVVPDSRNPLLDVTFDGARISNGEIVAAQPMIEIRLRDDNPYLALDEESVLEVGILYPSDDLKSFNYEPGLLEFFPAQLSGNTDNQATAIFTPTFTASGIYQLQVLAQDKTGNLAGDYIYTVDFEVNLEDYFSPVAAYPNPFSTTTQFVFEIKGESLPEDIYIEIFASDGKLIRRIEKNEMGNLRVGNNRTTIDWDGTDGFGQHLSDGLYFYRVWVRPSEAYPTAFEINSGTIVKSK